MKSIFKFLVGVAIAVCAVYGFCCIIDKYICKYVDLDDGECSDEFILTQIIKKLSDNYRNELKKFQKPSVEDDILD